jgi:uncharacterized membrane protein YfbV (UPF0208 family)
MRFLKTFAQGQHYAALWPRHAIVATLPEATVVPAVAFAARWMPALAVVNFLVQFHWQGAAMVPQAIITSLFLLSMPLQGWYWLGKRAHTQLPPRLQQWYLELMAKLGLQPQHQATYLALVVALNKALRELPPEQH